MKMIIKYRLVCIVIIIGLIITVVSCGQKREKVPDELVLSEIIIEKDGIYYGGDCENHAKDRFTGECKFYHDNGQLKGLVQIEDGLPTGHWKYWDSTGLEILDMCFEKGKLINKETP